MKNETNIDFRVTKSRRHTQSVVEMRRHGRYLLFQSGLGGFSSNFHILDRGYTGHEHLLDHGIINMNGRIYDPLLGQFMQADNYIQSPENFLDHNRYAYCRNNPFKYTDPSGEEFVINIMGVSIVIFGGSGSSGNDGALDLSQFEDELARLQNWMDSDFQIPSNGAQTLRNIPGGGGGGNYGGSQGVGIKPDGVYLVGNTPQELARSADGLSHIIHDRVIYDENTGRIMGRLNLDNSDAFGFVNELRGWFDELITNSEKNGKRIDIRFAKTKSNFDRRTGTLTINSYYLKNNVGNIPYETRSSWNLFGQSYPIYEQVLCHELFGHGLDWVNNLAGGDCLFELNAITRENYMLALFGRPLRLNYPDCGGPLEDWMYYWDSKDSKTRR